MSAPGHRFLRLLPSHGDGPGRTPDAGPAQAEAPTPLPVGSVEKALLRIALAELDKRINQELDRADQESLAGRHAAGLAIGAWAQGAEFAARYIRVALGLNQEPRA